ncbi:MAG: efflux RND transporter periplasmic adaptor subunit [Candidatus Roizmanbacteria bacterium]|nr:efflux RND transporter periplasmic adaptor subunit [Candidatus Roizmanbacteria bacterium]
MNIFKKGKEWFITKTLWIRILIVLVFIGIIGGVSYSLFGTKTTATQYQTGTVEKGMLVVAVTGSGTVSSANNTNITTQATGVVSKLYVKDGDKVKSGDKIMEIDLDLDGKQTASQALSSYQSAKNNVDSAQANMYSMQSSMFTNWDTFMKVAQNGTYQNEDGTPNNINRSLPEFHIANDNWLAAEAKYKLQQNVVYQAQTALNSAWSAYQKSSSTVYAPISGTVSGLALQIGSVINSNASSQTSNVSNTKIANVKTDATPIVSISLTEIDVPKITIGDKATVTLDAYPDKTFTGKVVSIDTVGSVSSGVTTYPTVIKLDTDTTTILPNMAVSANIITTRKNDVLMVPTSSIQQNTDGTYYVQVMKNNQASQVTVETGLASDTQTEIISGLSEGDTIVTATIKAATSTTTTTSPFSSFGGARTGGAAARLAH